MAKAKEKFIIDVTPKVKSRQVALFLEKDGDSVHLKGRVKGRDEDGAEWYILTLNSKGATLRCFIPDEVGLPVDNIGCIITRRECDTEEDGLV